MTGATYDTSVPALLVTIGTHTWDYGALATVRSLGRVGVPVYLAVTDPTMPAAASRYARGVVTWPTTGGEPAADLVAGIARMCERIGRPVVGIAGDDESAVLLAEYAAELAPGLLLPTVPPELPATLASKAGLADLCRATATPTPASIAPRDWAEVVAFADHATFPLVIKNPEPFSRLTTPAVSRTTRVADVEELRAALTDWEPGTAVLLQEFIPQDVSEDWYVEAVFDSRSEPLVAFSGRKLRAYPDSTGIGTLSEAVANPDLIGLAADFARGVGYVGVCDMDWRFDRRDGSFRLLDFNPRRGAQFRLFQSTAGVDVVRALHLNMTGRPVPDAPQVVGLRHVVGLQDQRAYLQQRRLGHELLPPLQRPQSERAWWAADDPKPAWTFISQLAPARRLRSALRSGAAGTRDA